MKWQTKVLATFVAATVPVESAGDVSPLLEAAKTIGDPPTDEDDETTAAKPGVNEPVVGSYERFMSTFGTPQRWAGRS
jgi:hypothetical protein